jgi:hypothetical protein
MFTQCFNCIVRAGWREPAFGADGGGNDVLVYFYEQDKRITQEYKYPVKKPFYIFLISQFVLPVLIKRLSFFQKAFRTQAILFQHTEKKQTRFSVAWKPFRAEIFY